jgi:uncharacterized membrane protein YqjE
MAIFGAPSDDASARGSGSSLRSALRTLLSFAETRARLAANEFEEQVLRVLEVAVWAAAALLLFAIALVFIALFIVLVFWDSNRLLAAGLVAAFFVAGGALSALMVRSGLAARPKFLAATLAELQKDRERMGGQ